MSLEKIWLILFGLDLQITESSSETKLLLFQLAQPLVLFNRVGRS